jgi:hypothetical protein
MSWSNEKRKTITVKLLNSGLQGEEAIALTILREKGEKQDTGRQRFPCIYKT